MQCANAAIRRAASARPSQVWRRASCNNNSIRLTITGQPGFQSQRSVAAAAAPSGPLESITSNKPASTSDLSNDGKVGGSNGASSKVRLVGISGSLRKDSVNTGLLRAAAKHIPPNATFEIVDISQLPIYNDDLWEGKDLKNDDSSLPEPLRTFRAKVLAADGVIFGCPEYNFSVSSPLKNAIDWGSKGPNVWQGKVFSAMGGGGGAGTARAQEHLRSIMTGLSAINVPGRSIQINRYVGNQFDEHGDVTDEKLDSWVAELVGRTSEYARKMKLLQTL